MNIPLQPKIYHITHLENLPEIIRHNYIISDAGRMGMGLDFNIIGISAIKQRRLERIEVKCHTGTRVGEYVPFYFCPRSIMLYILYRGNHPDLDYTGGQTPIVHLQADLKSTVNWAEQKNIRWAFSDRNAGSFIADFFNDLKYLDKINWEAVMASDFRDMQIKEGKQAEFLIYELFPWKLVEKIGVANRNILKSVKKMLKNSEHKPPVSIEPSWYY